MRPLWRRRENRAAARSGRRAVHRSESRWQPVLRRRPREWPPANVVEHGRWAILGAPAPRLSALSSRQREEHTATSAERMRALRERERRGLRRLTIGVSEDDLRVIAGRGYEGATSTDHDQRAHALSRIITDMLAARRSARNSVAAVATSFQ